MIVARPGKPGSRGDVNNFVRWFGSVDARLSVTPPVNAG